jgi:hypothetical protein
MAKTVSRETTGVTAPAVTPSDAPKPKAKRTRKPKAPPAQEFKINELFMVYIRQTKLDDFVAFLACHKSFEAYTQSNGQTMPMPMQGYAQQAPQMHMQAPAYPQVAYGSGQAPVYQQPPAYLPPTIPQFHGNPYAVQAAPSPPQQGLSTGMGQVPMRGTTLQDAEQTLPRTKG